jgi:hypothetical protein
VSLYHVQKLLFHLNNMPSVRRRFDAEREALLAEYRLSDEERRAVTHADVGKLHLMGVHPLLLAPFAGRAGLRWADYLAALRRAREAAGGG